MVLCKVNIFIVVPTHRKFAKYLYVDNILLVTIKIASINITL